MSRAPFTFYEFFAGGGMTRLGLGPGWGCLFANDFDPLKAATYRANFGDGHFREADVFDLTAGDLPGIADLAWASSPCQDFSLAGARAGLAGGRSSAFFGFWRLIEGLSAQGRAPRTVAIENVTGLLTSHGGVDFAAVCGALAGQGYRFGAIEVDAASFLPQSRRRVVIVGAREWAGSSDPSPCESHSVRRAREGLPAHLRRGWIGWGRTPPQGRNTNLSALLEPDEAAIWQGAARTERMIEMMNPRHRAKVRAAMAGGERRVGAMFLRVRGGVQRAEVRFDGLAGCLRTPRGGSSRQAVIVVEAGRVRSRLMSPRETARLMGLPDSYALPSAANAALHVTGDGVAAPVVRWLAREVLEPLLGPTPAVLAAE
ncbi:MAG TPA: DNA cytosine methyltransferase [Caulobacteraceae bacterium]